MLTRQFRYDLPEALIAQQPLRERSASRLLCVSGGQAPQHRHFSDLLEVLRPGDLLVFNNSRVIPARLHGHKASGGKVEALVERIESEKQALCHVRAGKAPGPGVHIAFPGGVLAEVVAREQDLFRLVFDVPTGLLDYLEQYGHMPLPPYIQRQDEQADRIRYQTVYAQEPGAIAAPTAGLHFDELLLERLTRAGIEMAYVTLHVGAGTFQPVRVEDVRQHKMHSEWLEVSTATCHQIAATRQRGGRVVAVGTTVVRSLETAARCGTLQAFRGNTDIFITPGYSFNVVDAMLTNFHLPCSTLLMLVCAFAGYSKVMQAYQLAIEHKYRFYSYGDAMYLEKTVQAPAGKIES